MTPVERRKDRPADEPVAARTPTGVTRTSSGITRTSTEATRTSTDVAPASADVAPPSTAAEQTSTGTGRVPPGTGRVPSAAEQVLADGLSRHAQRTLTCLHDSGGRGATTEDLSEAVGFTARTVAKHLDGLSRCGLVEQRGDGRWSVTDPAPASALDPASAPGRDAAPRGAALPAQQGRADQPADRRAAAVRPEEMQAAMPTPS
ncbi:helix-turn-helix domain-containing protein [Streptomyces sp. NPDC054863]